MFRKVSRIEVWGEDDKEEKSMFSDYEMMGNQKYLRIIASDNEHRNQSDSDMISNKEMQGFLRLNFTSSNGVDVYKYDVTDYDRLDECLRDFYSIEEMAEVIIKMIKAVQKLEGSGLSKDRIIMSKYSVYVRKADMDVRFIYLPVENIFGDADYLFRMMMIDILENNPFSDARLDKLICYLKQSRVVDYSVIVKMLEAVMNTGSEYVDISVITSDETVVEIVQKKERRFRLFKVGRKVKSQRRTRSDKKITGTRIGDMGFIKIPA